jgi:hypothetical protein
MNMLSHRENILYDSELKESLRMSPGVASPLPRVVPPSGASVRMIFIPGGVRKRRGARSVQQAN